MFQVCKMSSPVLTTTARAVIFPVCSTAPRALDSRTLKSITRLPPGMDRQRSEVPSTPRWKKDLDRQSITRENLKLEFSPEDLAAFFQNMNQGSGSCSKRHSLTHKMKRFSSGIEDYAVWKQDLLINLEREDLHTEKDKAIFVYRFLEGDAEHKNLHLFRPLTDESFKSMMRMLDLLYRTEFDLDRLLVRRLSSLRKLDVLTRDNLSHLLVTMNAAFPALQRRNS